MPSILADIYWAGSLLPRDPNDPVYPVNSCFTQIFEWRTKNTLFVTIFPEVAQNSLRIPWVFNIQRNLWVFQDFQVCGHPGFPQQNIIFSGNSTFILSLIHSIIWSWSRRPPADCCCQTPLSVHHRTLHGNTRCELQATLDDQTLDDLRPQMWRHWITHCWPVSAGHVTDRSLEAL